MNKQSRWSPYEFLAIAILADGNYVPRACTVRVESIITINVPLFKKLRDIIFFGGRITL